MASELGLLIGALLVFLYALVGRRLSSTILTAPMIFLFAGWALHKAGLVAPSEHGHGLHILAEVSLIVLLFADAAMIEPKRLLRDAAKPARMLVLGLPLMIALGFVAGWLLLPDWPLWEIALIAAILAPTDAALGQAVVTNPKIPEKIRQTLSAESGLNDGLALPFVVFFGSFAVGGLEGQPESWGVFVAQQIGMGALAGLLTGVIGGLMLRGAEALKLSSDSFGGVAVLALAGLSYLVSGELGGNGFLAAFIGGLAFGAVMRGRNAFVFEFIETEGQLLTVLSFLVIGAVLMPQGLPEVSLGAAVLILLSLFVLRPLAISLSLIGTGTPRFERLYLGWFGPRGLATALFALLVLDEFQTLTMHEQVLNVASTAVLFSVVLHGITAAPSARLFKSSGKDQS